MKIKDLKKLIKITTKDSIVTCLATQLGLGGVYSEEACLIATEKTGKKITTQDLRQDDDVLDTWFSIWLWPISVFRGLTAPENPEINYYFPTNDLVLEFDYKLDRLPVLYIDNSALSGTSLSSPDTAVYVAPADTAQISNTTRVESPVIYLGEKRFSIEYNNIPIWTATRINQGFYEHVRLDLPSLSSFAIALLREPQEMITKLIPFVPDAIAQTSPVARAIGEDVAEVAVAMGRTDFGSDHAVGAVAQLGDIRVLDRPREARPATAGFVFVRRRKKRLAGNDIDIDPSGFVIQKLAGSRAFCPVLLGHAEFLCVELGDGVRVFEIARHETSCIWAT